MKRDTIKSKFGYDIATYAWFPPTSPKFVFYLIHGYAEYAGCEGFKRYIKEIVDLGGVVYSHDHFAHGESGPYPKTHKLRCQIKDFHESTEDINDRLVWVKEQHSDLKVIIGGHSMGGLLALQVVEMDKVNVNGVMVTAPAIKLDPATAPPWMVKIGKFASRFFPNFKSPMTFDLSLVSRNKEYCEHLDKQNVDYGDNGGYTIGFGSRMMAAQESLQSWLPKFPKALPLWISTGSADQITTPAGSQLVHEIVPHSTLDIYEGARHSIFNELPEVTEQFFQDMTKWISSQVH